MVNPETSRAPQTSLLDSINYEDLEFNPGPTDTSHWAVAYSPAGHKIIISESGKISTAAIEYPTREQALGVLIQFARHFIDVGGSVELLYVAQGPLPPAEESSTGEPVHKVLSSDTELDETLEAMQKHGVFIARVNAGSELSVVANGLSTVAIGNPEVSLTASNYGELTQAARDISWQEPSTAAG